MLNAIPSSFTTPAQSSHAIGLAQHYGVRSTSDAIEEGHRAFHAGRYAILRGIWAPERRWANLLSRLNLRSVSVSYSVSV